MLAGVYRHIQLPVVTGEELCEKAEFCLVFEERAANIINPDVCNGGGILELKEIAAMAEAYHVVIASHNYNSTTIGLAATLQAAAVMPNFIITEYFVNFDSVGLESSQPPFMVENGYIEFPSKPGLGAGLKEDVLFQYPDQQFSLWSICCPRDERP